MYKRQIILNMDVLHPLSAGLIRGIHIDGRHQFTESIRGEFFNMNVLVRLLDELFNILDLLFLYFNFLLDGEKDVYKRQRQGRGAF